MSESLSNSQSRRPLSVENLEDRTNPTAILTENFSAFAPDRVLVTLESSATASTLTTTNLVSSAQLLGGSTYLVQLNTGISVTQAVSTFSTLAGVRAAEPDFDVGVRVIPNDPEFGSLWGLNNSNDADIDAPEAWDVARGNRTTIVGVIDTGVLFTHPDLAANMWTNTGEIAGNNVDDDGNGFTDDIYGWDFANNDSNPTDDNGHGTHVAGTIGARGNNGTGVVGVAWDTRIMALKFLGASGSGSTSGAVSAIYYGVNNGAKILNNSWGGGGFSQSLFDAINYANSKGVIFVAAAGNSSSNNDTTPNFPSNYALPNVVAVASTTNTDALSSFSSFGATTVDLGAPGSNIRSTYLNNGYASLSGTSMATPHVAGALAVYWDANATQSSTAVINRLLSTVDPVTALNGRTVTGGRLNLNRMLTGSQPPAFNSGARVLSAAFTGPVANSFNNVRLTFSEAIEASTLNSTNVTLTGPSGALPITSFIQVNATTFDVRFTTQSAFGNYSLMVGTGVQDLAGNALNQNNNQINGENPADRFVGTANIVPPFQIFTYTSNAQVTIRDRATVTSTLLVSSVPGQTTVPFSDLNVSVNLTHTWTSDLRITLIAPNGARVQLFNRRGGSGDNLTNTLFNDEAATLISAGAAPFSGSFKPEQALSALDGLPAAGSWTLEIADLAAGDVGLLRSFGLTFTTGTPPAGQSVQTFGMLDGNPDLPGDVKADLNLPTIVDATPAAPITAAPITAASTSPTSPVVVGTPTVPTSVAVSSPFVVVNNTPPAASDSAAPVLSQPATIRSQNLGVEVAPSNSATEKPLPMFQVDAASLLKLFGEADPFAPFVL